MRVQPLPSDVDATALFPHRPTSRSQIILAATACFLALAATWFARQSPIPIVWGALALTLACIGAERLTRRAAVRALWINMAVLFATLGLAELYVWSHEPLEREMQYGEGFFLPDETLGYKPAAGRTLSHRTEARGRLLYEVQYTIDQDGLRATEATDSEQTAGASCLVFFGDSFTFGEGISDGQTMPAQVRKKLGGTVRVVNFGFLGYGPHQMLATLQGGRLESQGHCRPSHVIYQAIPSHVSRAAGLESWDPNGPRYVLEDATRIRRTGHLDEAPAQSSLDWYRRWHQRIPWQIRKAFDRSALHRLILRSHRTVEPQDVALFAGIVEEARSILERRYPDAQFHVLLWDFEGEQSIVDQMLPLLREHKLDLHPISDILPNFPSDEGRYEISPYDRHPNALAHELIAEFVVHHLVGNGS